MNPLNRRQLFSTAGYGLGAAALSSLVETGVPVTSTQATAAEFKTPADYLRYAPRAKRVIFLFMQGGVSQIETFDYKPAVRQVHGIQLPDSIRQGQRLGGLSAGQTSFPCVAPMFQFRRHGQSGGWVSELLPQTASIIDEITVIGVRSSWQTRFTSPMTRWFAPCSATYRKPEAFCPLICPGR